MKVLTWNVGSFSFMKYFRKHEYFQSELNGEFVSEFIRENDPDIIFLQEIHDDGDIRSIDVLNTYPYVVFINTWYHQHSICVASKKSIVQIEIGNFSVISCEGISYIPVHLNSFSADKRLIDINFLANYASRERRLVVLGDTNVWNRKNTFLFKKDRQAYGVLSRSLRDFSINIISTSYLGFALDKVFGSKDLSVKKVESPKIRGVYMDHYPIICKLDLL